MRGEGRGQAARKHFGQSKNSATQQPRYKHVYTDKMTSTGARVVNFSLEFLCLLFFVFVSSLGQDTGIPETSATTT